MKHYNKASVTQTLLIGFSMPNSVYQYSEAMTMGGRVERLPRKRNVGCSNLSREGPTVLKQVVIAPLPNACQ